MKALSLFIVSLFVATGVRADVFDDAAALQRQWDTAIIDVYADDWQPAEWAPLQASVRSFAQHLQSPDAKQLWLGNLPAKVETPLDAATWLGRRQSILQHVCALEMLQR